MISQEFFLPGWYDPFGGVDVKGILQKIAVSVGMLWLVNVAASMFVGADQHTVFEATQPTVLQVEEAAEATVNLILSSGTEEMTLEEYVLGVLLCEMPTQFHTEAKKAQAVAARTFALRTSNEGLKHGQGMICGESGCCQGYCSAEDYLRHGGTQDGIEQARQAVVQTRGLVLVYQEELIEATYFSCSGGRTEDAVAVWGMDVPYLQAVDSPGEEDAAYYTETVLFSAQEFQTALGVSLSGPPSGWFGSVSYTDGNGVGTMVIGGKEYSGTQLRRLLGLRSSSFTVTVLSESVLITTRGFGHRVGMSQYGAEAMAQNGSSWEDILMHYYQGVSVSELEH